MILGIFHLQSHEQAVINSPATRGQGEGWSLMENQGKLRHWQEKGCLGE